MDGIAHANLILSNYFYILTALRIFQVNLALQVKGCWLVLTGATTTPTTSGNMPPSATKPATILLH